MADDFNETLIHAMKVFSFDRTTSNRQALLDLVQAELARAKLEGAKGLVPLSVCGNYVFLEGSGARRIVEEPLESAVASGLPDDKLPPAYPGLTRYGWDGSLGGDFGVTEDGPYLLKKEVDSCALARVGAISAIAQRVFDQADAASSHEPYGKGVKAGIEALEQALIASLVPEESVRHAAGEAAAQRVAEYLAARSRGGLKADHIHGMSGKQSLLVSDLRMLLSMTNPQEAGVFNG